MAFFTKDQLYTKPAPEERLAMIEHFIRQSIADEQKAIADYQNRRSQILEYMDEETDLDKKEKYKDFANVLNSVSEEEVVHVGEFSALLDLFGFTPDTEAEGKKEAEGLIANEGLSALITKLRQLVD
jgi:rubrerythrin